MKKLVYLLFILFLGLSLSTNTYSQEKETKENKETVEDSSQATESGKAFNTICPVSTEDVDPEITYTYKGKTYAFCCNKCLKKFKDDPEKYSSRLSEDGKSIKKKS